jgi:hypothetical protein
MLTCALRAQDKEPKSRNIPSNFVHSIYYKVTMLGSLSCALRAQVNISLSLILELSEEKDLMDHDSSSCY